MTNQRRLGRWSVLAAAGLLACAGPSRTGDVEPGSAAPTSVSPALDEQPGCPPVPGTRVCLDVPPGHEPGQGFDGYQWPATGSSLIIVEFPGGQPEIAEAFAATGPIAQGMTVLHTQSVQACGGEGRLAQVSQTAAGTLYHKWVLICADDDATLLLNAVYPASEEEALSESLRAAVLSAVWDPSLVVDPFTKVDWSIEHPPELALAHETGGMFIYTRDGVLEQQDARAPFFLVGPSMGTVAIEELRASAETRFHQLAGIQAIEIASSQAIEIAGLPAWEIVGQARDAKSNHPLSVYQVMIARGDGYVLVVGMVDVQATDWVERFRASASSWKPKG